MPNIYTSNVFVDFFSLLWIYTPVQDEIPATNEFREWMDQRGLRAADVREGLRIEEQTVRKWRSQGVPERKLPHVRRYMAEWKSPVLSEPPPNSVSDQVVSDFVASRQNLVLHPDPDVFNAWTAAFKHSRAETLEQWAIDGLSQLAKHRILKVTEPPPVSIEPTETEEEA